MANKKITDLMSGTPVRDSLLESAIDISGTMDSRKVKAGVIADLASANVAALYDSTVTYAIGQYCLYEGDIYRCIAITTGAFDSTAWVQIVVTGEFRRVVELTSAQYTALSSAEKYNGTLYVKTDEETTAADIPYSAGVSVADKLDNVPTFNTLTTSDNNKLLGVSVSGGGDISVGAVYRDVRSTTEKRVGTWINGKPLYEKIITFTNSASSTSDYVQVEQIANLEMVTQVNWTVKRVTGGNTFWYTGSGASNPEIDTQYSNYKIAFRVLNGWLEYGFVGYAGHWLTDCYVRVQYTKTTD